MIVYHIVNGNPLSSDTGGIRAYIRDAIQTNNGEEISQYVIGTALPDFKSLIAITKRRKPNFYFFLSLCVKAPHLPNNKNVIYHFHQPYMLLPFLLKKKAVFVLTLHGQQDYSVAKRKSKISFKIYQFFNKTLLKKFHGIISDNQMLIDYYEKIYHIKFKYKTIIPVGVDTSRFFPQNKYALRKKYGYNELEKIILFTGRLAHEKNIFLGIDAFKMVKINLEDNVRFLIIGSGPLQKSLEEKVNKENIENVEFLGNIKNDLIPEYMSISDILIITSFNEGGPIVLKEAIACNLKVVAVPVGDAPIVIPKCLGSRLSGYQVSDFAYNIIKSLKDESLIDYSSIALNYSKLSFQNKLYSFYESLFSKKSNIND